MAATKQTLAYSLVFALGLAGASFAAETPEIITLRSKAVHGNAIAQYNLGRIFADSKSNNADRAEAFVWFQIAADNGVSGRELARLVEVMTPQELAEGKTRLQERRAQLVSLRDPVAAKVEAPSNPAPDDNLTRLTAERDQLASSLNAATAELASLRATIAKGAKTEPQPDKPDDVTRLTTELNELRATTRQLAAKNAQLEDVASERGRDLQSAHAELAKAKSEASPAPVAAPQDSQLTALIAERDLLLKQLGDAQVQARRMSELPEKLSRSERDADLLRKQNGNLGVSLREAEAQLKALSEAKSSISTERSARTQAESELARQLESAKAAGEELARSQKDLSELNKKNLELADRAQRGYAAEQELAIARERIASEQKKNEDLTSSAAQLALANEKLRREVGSKSSSADTEALSARIASLEKQNAELSDRAMSAEAKIAAIPATAPAPASTAVAGQPQATPESDSFQKQLEETSDKLNTVLRSYTLLQQELEQTKSAASQSLAEVNAKLAVAQSEISTLQGQLGTATGESQERASSLNTTQQEMEKIRHTMLTQGQENLALRDQLRQTLGQVAVLVDENSQLKTRLAVLAPPPASSLASPTRPGTAAAQNAITLPPALAKPAAVTEARHHIIGDGDTLSKISRKYYGTPDRWNEIYQANRKILGDPSRLPKGADLRIP